MIRNSFRLTALFFFGLNVLSCKSRTLNETSEVKATNSTPAYAILEAERAHFANAHYRTFDHHDRTYYRLNDLIANGDFPANRQWTIFHFDNHSDMYRNDSHLEGNINIGNYINTMVWKRQVNKVYWIIPDATESSAPLQPVNGCQSIPNKRDLFWERTELVDLQFRDGPKNQLICMHSNGHFSFLPATSKCPNESGMTTIPFYKRTIEQLLNETSPSIGEHTIIDIDLDFFDTSGLYANELPGLNPSPQCYDTHYNPAELQNQFTRFSTLVTQKLNLYPDYITASRSPGYTVQNIPPIFRFAKCLGSKVGKSKKAEGISDQRLYDYRYLLDEVACEH